MKSIMVILVLVAFVKAKPCQVPRRLSGDFNVFTFNVDEGKVVSIIEGTTYIDQEHKRIRIEGHFGETNKYKVIQLFDERIQYVISEGHCRTMPVTGEFKDMNIPANASIVDKGRIGPASDGLNIFRYAEISAEGKYLETVTQKDCITTSKVGVVKVEGVHYVVYLSFTGASLDFDDAVFDVPSECREVPARSRRSVEWFLNNLKHFIGA
ncbi:uncharacterized protein LOC116300941 [Actinia tenebrosa]|uniref:Uncharacterized protein LOC116300941 n=1 Tax=Actinia tenebrosa TaxID=6105 RepID=A0A6P8IGE3_ACTTE|nr:uncharacterized protein LOC116300941 [Actinia tenebrosa]